MKTRSAQLKRKTEETDIQLQLKLDGAGKSRIQTGIPFFDHMLTLFAKHALLDLQLTCKGDLEVDFHHTVEDVGIALGQTLTKALGNKKGISRYGHAYAPMDETLVRVALDISGRPYLAYHVRTRLFKAGDFPIQLVEEFCRALAVHAGITLHIELLYGKDPHHIVEAIFKALAKATDMACRKDPRVKTIPSTKGIL
ncbi:MAG: imidazoleglycerol-phosphate dehydratase HisB [Verrucomicrobiae bacterium]|nr:imidazoleglycerol-phosphate dehydratase HisB [Verrucomicrobiae bacterium]